MKGLTKPQKSKPFKLKAGIVLPKSPGCSRGAAPASLLPSPPPASHPGCHQTWCFCVVLSLRGAGIWSPGICLPRSQLPWDAELQESPGGFLPMLTACEASRGAEEQRGPVWSSGVRDEALSPCKPFGTPWCKQPNPALLQGGILEPGKPAMGTH